MSESKTPGGVILRDVHHGPHEPRQSDKKYRAKNISVSVIEQGADLKVWNVAFTIPGELMRDDKGRVDEAHRKVIEKKIAEVLATVDFPDLGW